MNQQYRLYLLESFIEKNMFVRGQKLEIMDDKHKGVAGSANLYLDEHPIMKDLYNPSHNCWVCSNTSRQVLMLLKLLDILLHLETHGALTSTRIIQTLPRHPHYCMYKLSVLLNKPLNTWQHTIVKHCLWGLQIAQIMPLALSFVFPFFNQSLLAYASYAIIMCRWEKHAKPILWQFCRVWVT